jgi:hypothetical protein
MTTQTLGNRPKIYWVGRSPVACDCCGIGIHSVFVDGATILGPWGNLHPACHANIGRGLGLGLGQRYEKQADGRWLRVEG